MVERVLLFDKRLEVCIPNSFSKMNNDKVEMMFPYAERPQVILEEKDTSRFCTFSLLEKQSLVGVQVKYVIHSIEDAITSLYPSCLLLKPEIAKLKNGLCGWFAYQTSGKGGNLFNIMYVYPVKGKMMLGTMGCFLDDEEGKIRIKDIMLSLNVCEKSTAHAKIRIDLPYKKQ